MSQVKHFLATTVSTSRSQLGEGPVWVHRDGLLYWTDISGCVIRSFDPKTKQESLFMDTKPLRVGCFARCSCAEPKLIAAAENGFYLISKPTATSVPIQLLADVKVSSQKPTRFNDGKVDPKGTRFLAGQMSDIKPRLSGDGSMFVFENNQCKKVQHIGSVTVSNGLCWSVDAKSFYYIDTPTKKVVKYDYNISTGEISGSPITVFELNDNLPGGFDGMTIDKNGNLWIALYRGSSVICVDITSPSTQTTKAKIIAIVDVPAKLVTSCCFGGDDLNTLFITTASTEEPENPNAGALFAVENIGVSGLPFNEFQFQ